MMRTERRLLTSKTVFVGMLAKNGNNFVGDIMSEVVVVRCRAVVRFLGPFYCSRRILRSFINWFWHLRRYLHISSKCMWIGHTMPVISFLLLAQKTFEWYKHISSTPVVFVTISLLSATPGSTTNKVASSFGCLPTFCPICVLLSIWCLW